MGPQRVNDTKKIIDFFLSFLGVKCTVWCGAIVKCNSKDYSYRECGVLSDNTLRIVNVTVKVQTSNAACNFYNGPYTDYDGADGVYGFQKDVIWVHKGCQALFHYCYTG